MPNRSRRLVRIGDDVSTGKLVKVYTHVSTSKVYPYNSQKRGWVPAGAPVIDNRETEDETDSPGLRG